MINFEEVETQAQEKLATMLEECMTLFEAVGSSVGPSV